MKRNIWLLILVVLFVAGCGKDKNDDSNNASQQTEIKSVEVVIEISPTVPTETTAAIQEIVTDDASGSVGTTLKTPERDSLVLALDNDDNILLASYTSDQDITLDAESTAVSLALIGLVKPKDLATEKLIEFIKASADFGVLVSLINTQLSAGQPLIDSDEIFASVDAVMQQASEKMGSYLNSLNLSAQSLKILSKDNLLSEPFIVLPAGLGRNLSIDAKGMLANNIPVAFGIEQVSPDNSTITSPGTIIGARNFNIDLLRLAWNLGTLIISGESNFSGATSLPLNMEKSFSLQVKQTSDTQLLNLGLIANHMASVVLPIAVKNSNQQCLAAWAKVLFPSNKFIELTSSSGMEGFAKYFADLSWYKYIKQTLDKNKLIELNNKCAVSNAQTIESFLKKIKAMAKILSKYTKYVVPAQTAVSAATLSERIGTVGAMWNTDVKVTVCVSETNTVANCANDFYLDDNYVTSAIDANYDGEIFATGASTSGSLKAIDSGNNPTLMPIEFSTTTGGDLKLERAENSTAVKVTASSNPGSGYLLVTDEATGVDATMKYYFIDPVFQGVDSINIEHDETQELKLVHPDYKHSPPEVNPDVLFMNTGQFVFSSDQESIVKIIGQESTNSSATVEIKGIADGKAIITARNTITGHEEKISVNVEAPVYTYSGGLTLIGSYAAYDVRGGACVITIAGDATVDLAPTENTNGTMYFTGIETVNWCDGTTTTASQSWNFPIKVENGIVNSEKIYNDSIYVCTETANGTFDGNVLDITFKRSWTLNGQFTHMVSGSSSLVKQ